MSEDDQTPDPADADAETLRQLGLQLDPAIVAGGDQLRASVSQYTKCVVETFKSLQAGGFEHRVAQEMSMILWEKLLVPNEDEEAYEA